MSTVIKVENLSKSYIIKHQQREKYTALRDVIVDKTKELFSLKHSASKLKHEEFWALKDISFEIKQGERVGIIGRNGAGKSTLLKILSRITTPTKGRITLEGRVASLLEVGTGFHPELSGRENIFLNGSILGMSKVEINKKFDEIVAFSEVEKFLDTPVKRYSSGMYVRLAFAVAAHLEPEILIIDEVLAVGDAQFQKKCIGKMEDVSKNLGRTIIFVSHNIGAVRSLCNRAILLSSGEIQKSDTVDAVIPYYLGVLKNGMVDEIKIEATPISGSGEWDINSDISITISWDKHRFEPGWQCDLACYTFDGVKIFALESEKFSGFSSADPDCNAVNFKIKNIGFNNSDLRLDVGIKKNKNLPYCKVIENCVTLSPSGRMIPEYRRHDVITIPNALCTAIKI